MKVSENVRESMRRTATPYVVSSAGTLHHGSCAVAASLPAATLWELLQRLGAENPRSCLRCGPTPRTWIKHQEVVFSCAAAMEAGS